MTESFDIVKALQDNSENMRVPGGLLTRVGPQDYVGSVPAISGTLFFENAHHPNVRDAICACFEDYEAIAKKHLTWLWREEPPEGPDKQPYAKAKPMHALLGRMDEDDLVSFIYTSGTQAHDAGDWEFQVSGVRAWKAKMGRRLSVLRFSLPLLYVEQNPQAFQTLFVSFAGRLKALHGYGGHGLVLSAVRVEDNEPFEAHLADKLNGLDVGEPVRVSSKVLEGFKTVSWLTALSNEMIEKIGGLSALRSELPMDWFALYDYGAGLVIQAGPKPEAAPVDKDPRPARYVLPNMLFKPLRTPRIGSLHHDSKEGEPRLAGWAAQQWLQRFDVAEDELAAYKAKLLDEPKLTTQTSLAARL